MDGRTHTSANNNLSSEYLLKIKINRNWARSWWVTNMQSKTKNKKEKKKQNKQHRSFHSGTEQNRSVVALVAGQQDRTDQLWPWSARQSRSAIHGHTSFIWVSARSSTNRFYPYWQPSSNLTLAKLAAQPINLQPDSTQQSTSPSPSDQQVQSHTGLE